MWISIGVIISIIIAFYILYDMKKKSFEYSIKNIKEEYSQYKEIIEKKLENYKIMDRIFGMTNSNDYKKFDFFISELSNFSKNKNIKIKNNGNDFTIKNIENYSPEIINFFNEPMMRIIKEYIELLKWYPILKDNYERDKNYLQSTTDTLIKVNKIAEKINKQDASFSLNNIINEIERDCPQFLKITLYDYLIKCNFDKEILLSKINIIENNIKETEIFIENSIPKEYKKQKKRIEFRLRKFSDDIQNALYFIVNQGYVTLMSEEYHENGYNCANKVDYEMLDISIINTILSKKNNPKNIEQLNVNEKIFYENIENSNIQLFFLYLLSIGNINIKEFKVYMENCGIITKVENENCTSLNKR